MTATAVTSPAAVQLVALAPTFQLARRSHPRSIRSLFFMITVDSRIAYELSGSDLEMPQGVAAAV